MINKNKNLEFFAISKQNSYLSNKEHHKNVFYDLKANQCRYNWFEMRSSCTHKKL